MNIKERPLQCSATPNVFSHEIKRRKRNAKVQGKALNIKYNTCAGKN